MRRSFILFLAIAAIIWPHAARAEHPGFMMHFSFHPSILSRGAIPNGFLDLCRDNFCNGGPAGVIALNCIGRHVSNSADTYIDDCSTRAVVTPRGPDANLVMLDHPVILRLRLNALMSEPFNFPGGTATEPLARYRFTVSLAGNSLIITPN